MTEEQFVVYFTVGVVLIWGYLSPRNGFLFLTICWLWWFPLIVKLIK